MKELFLTLVLVWGQFYYTYSSDSPKELLFIKADSLFDAGNYEAAHQVIDDFITASLNSSIVDYAIISQAYNRKGLFLRLAGANYKANEQISESLKFAVLANDSTEIANAFRELGYNCVILGKYQEGLEAYNNALIIDERNNDIENVSIDINAIGKIYEVWRRFDKALEFYHRSLEIAQGNNNLNQVAVRMASIASVYKSQEKFDLALEWLQKSLAIEMELGNVVPKGYRLDQIGEVYTHLSQYQKAEDYLRQALAIFQEHKVYVSESIVLNHLALNYFRKGAVQNAVSHYNQSLAIAQRVGFSNMILKNHQELSLLYEQTGNFAEALDHYRRFFVLKDSVYNERAQRQLMDFQAKYETEQKEKELALLSHENLMQELKLNQANQQKHLMIGVSLVLLILLGSLLSRYNIKKKTQQQLTEINTKLNDLNNTKDKLFSLIAHDLRNSIYGFSTIVETLNNKYDSISSDNIKHYLREVAQSANSLKGMLRNLLGWAQSQQNNIVVKLEPIAICDIIEGVIAQVMPVANLKGITVTKQLPRDYNVVSDYNILETTLRNLLSNAIKYSNEGGTVEISSSLNNGMFEIIVSDNGVGMSKEDVISLQNTKCFAQAKPGIDGEKGSGLGLMLCKELLQRISGQLLVRSEQGRGSSFTIVFPYAANHEN